tara:strand:- start:1688 stop:2596 length:909 start_codon:yes stop_codon:yes gene_type:complete
MPRFKFSQRILNKFPNKSDINQINDDFETYINDTGIPTENVSDESIRFRHLVEAPTVLLYSEAGEAIYNAGTIGAPGSITSFYGASSASFIPYRTVHLSDSLADATVAPFSYSGSIASGKVLEITIVYYPYNQCPKTEVCIMYHISGEPEDTWHAMEASARTIGMKAGWSGLFDITPFNPGRGLSLEQGFYRHRHPVLGRLSMTSVYNKTGVRKHDVSKCVAHGGRVVLQRQIGTEGINGVSLSKIDGFRMGIKADLTKFSFSAGDVMPDIPIVQVAGAPGDLKGSNSPYDDYTIMLLSRSR